MKNILAITALIVALDHLLFDAVLFENATERLLGQRHRLF